MLKRKAINLLAILTALAMCLCVMIPTEASAAPVDYSSIPSSELPASLGGNLHGSAEPRQPLRVLKYRPGMASELLIRCKYFEVYRMLINTERRQTVHYRADRMAFRVLLCMDGCGTISYDEGTVNFYKGDCVFVPADTFHLAGRYR